MSFHDISLVHVDPSSFTKKRKRAVTACVYCHERKVKCDGRRSPNTKSCKNCLAAGVPCRAHRDGRARGTNTSQHSEVSPFTASTPLPDLTHKTIPGLVGPGETVMLMAGPEGTRENSSNPESQPREDVAADKADDSHVGDAHGHGPLVAMPLTIQTPIPRIHASLDRFEAYIEDTLGSYAPSFKHHGDIALDSRRHGEAQPEIEPGHATTRLEIEMASRPTLELEQQVASLDPADTEYLRAKGAFDLPPRKLQEELINAYFAEVHPTAPVINKFEFLSAFHSHQMLSRLLLFAVFTSGARACRNPALLDDNGTVHKTAQRFYKATKALLDTGYEPNKLRRIQALLLITWWWDKKDDGGRNMRSCSVDAVNTAQSIGMHRWDHYPQSDPALIGLWKRIWWSCFNRDVGVAVAHGLPLMVLLRDFDVPSLTPDDFVEEAGVAIDDHKYPHSDVEIHFFIKLTQVMEALYHIHSGYFVRMRLQDHMVGSIAQREARSKHKLAPPGNKVDRNWLPDNYQDDGLLLCKSWIDQLPGIVAYDVDDIQGHRFWPAFVHILYYTAIMLRFREQSVSRPTGGRGIAERQYCQARGIAAATMVSKIVRNVRAHGQVLRCTGQLTNSIFNCLIFFLIEGQSLDPDVRKDAQQKYSLCLNVLYDFSQLWVSAALIHRLFEALQAHMHVSSKRPASVFSGQMHSPVPGLHITSSITNSYMKELLITDFHYDSSSADVPSFGHTSSSLGRFTPQTQYMLDETLPELDQTLGVSFPETLNVDQWVDFFGLGDVELEQTGPDFFLWRDA